MFLTFDPNKKSISQKISEKFSSSASKLDCKNIHQILGLQRSEIKGLFFEIEVVSVFFEFHLLY